MRFLIDECLTVELVTVAGDAGYEAHHVAHVGKAGWKDWNVLRYACENDLVLVTNNAADFRKLYADQSLHAGLVILIPNATADLQKSLFKGAVDNLTAHGEPINQVLEVDLDGEDMIFEFTSYRRPTDVILLQRGDTVRDSLRSSRSAVLGVVDAGGVTLGRDSIQRSTSFLRQPIEFGESCTRLGNWPRLSRR